MKNNILAVCKAFGCLLCGYPIPKKRDIIEIARTYRASKGLPQVAVPDWFHNSETP